MSTFTAQILVGQSHTYDGGIINIHHMLYLSEGNAPAWVLSPMNLFERKQYNPIEENRVWIPSATENILEEGLLMYGLYVLKDEKLEEMANKYIPNIDNTRLELYRDVKEVHLESMYQRLRAVQSNHKLVISVFRGSSIIRQLEVLRNYQLEVEVTQSSFVREYNPFKRMMEERGELRNDRF